MKCSLRITRFHFGEHPCHRCCEAFAPVHGGTFQATNWSQWHIHPPPVVSNSRLAEATAFRKGEGHSQLYIKNSPSELRSLVAAEKPQLVLQAEIPARDNAPSTAVQTMLDNLQEMAPELQRRAPDKSVFYSGSEDIDTLIANAVDTEEAASMMAAAMAGFTITHPTILAEPRNSIGLIDLRRERSVPLLCRYSSCQYSMLYEK